MAQFQNVGYANGSGAGGAARLVASRGGWSYGRFVVIEVFSDGSATIYLNAGVGGMVGKSATGLGVCYNQYVFVPVPRHRFGAQACRLRFHIRFESQFWERTDPMPTADAPPAGAIAGFARPRAAS